MKRTARDWRVQYQKDEGFTLRLEETRFWGVVAEAAFFKLTDHEWFGKYRNFPFCWINPWNWTHHLGTEDHNVGYWWWKTGQWVCNRTDGWRRATEVTVIPVSNDWVREHLPDTWRDLGFLADPSVPSPWDEDDEEKAE